MATKILNIQDYSSYIKCGEILKSPLPNYQHPFVLKCYECDKINFMLESFIIHIQEHCNESTVSQQDIKIASENEVESESIENPIVKIETFNMEVDDPLVVVKDEQEMQIKTEVEEIGSNNLDESDDQEEGKTNNTDEEEDNAWNSEDVDTEDDEFSIKAKENNTNFNSLFQNSQNLTTLQTVHNNSCSEDHNVIHAESMTLEGMVAKFSKVIEPMFTGLTNEVNSLRQEINGLRNEIKELRKDKSEEKLVLPDNPFKIMEEFLNFEKLLQDDKSFLKSFQKELLTVAKSPNYTKNCWRKLLTDELAEHLCWKGTAEKKSARSLSVTRAIRMQSNSLKSLVRHLRDEIKSLKSEISILHKEVKELKDGNKKSLTKLTEEIVALKFESRKHHGVSIDDYKDVQKLPLIAMEDLENFDGELQENEDKIRQFILHKTTKRKRKSSLSVGVEKFTKSKQQMKTLIELYKNQPNLWNKDLPLYRFRDKRQAFLEEITKDLNNKLKTIYTSKEVSEVIRYIFKKHRDDFKRLRLYEEEEDKNPKDNKYKCCWFFDDLYFLRPKTVIELRKLDTNLPDMSTEQVMQIIQIYQDQPHLWNSNLIEYICSNKRNEALAEMSKSVEKAMNINVNDKALEEYIRSIHSYFSKEKRLRRKNTAAESKNHADDYYEQLLFLYDHEGPFNCTDCKRVFTKPLGFRVHKSNHDDSVPFICSQCNKEFKTIPTYTVHAKRHFADLDFVCNVCNRKFVAYADLRVHSLTHSGDRPYCCEKCGASYRHVQCFKRHQRRHEKRYTHQCSICSKGYYSKDRYDDHMNSHMNIRSHICQLCGRGFITSRALKTHAVTHEDARNHACKLCGKTFKLKIGVLQHMRTHGTRVESDDKN